MSLLEAPRATSFDLAGLIERFRDRDATIAIVGMGYVGIPLLGRTTTWTRVGSENRQCQH